MATLMMVVANTADRAPSNTVTVMSQRWAEERISGSALADVNVYLHHHAGAQQHILLVDQQPHRQPLGDLGEIAAGVGVRQQGEFAGGGASNAVDGGGEFT